MNVSFNNLNFVHLSLTVQDTGLDSTSKEDDLLQTRDVEDVDRVLRAGERDSRCWSRRDVDADR